MIVEKIDRLLNEIRLSSAEKQVISKILDKNRSGKDIITVGGTDVEYIMTNKSATFIYDDKMFHITDTLVDMADERELKFEPVSLGRKMNFVILK